MTLDTIPSTGLAGHKLLVLSPWQLPDDYVSKLEKAHPKLEVMVRHYDWMKTSSDLTPEEWKDISILVTGSTLPNWSCGELTPKLQYVQLFSAGANHIADHEVFLDHNITFCGANGVHGPQIAEWVMATYLSTKHRLAMHQQNQIENKWGHLTDRLSDAVEDSVGRRVGILGYGSIGRQVARLARALGMSIHAYTLNPRTTPESRLDDAYSPHDLGDPDGSLPDRWFSGISRQYIHEFLDSGLDLLVIALPLTNHTRGLIGPDELAILAKRRTFLSNVARGAIIDTVALIEALNTEQLSGAALDVTDPEPLPVGHPLWTAKNTIITPHISGSSTRYLERVLEIVEINLQRIEAGKTPLLNQLNKKAGY